MNMDTQNTSAYFGLEVGSLPKPAFSGDPCCQRGESKKQEIFPVMYCT